MGYTHIHSELSKMLQSTIKFPTEWLNSWAREVHGMSGVLWITLFVKLPTVVAESKQANGATDCLWATRKTTRFASQIMAQLCIICFHRIGVELSFRSFVATEVIPKMSIGIKTIRVIPFDFGYLIHHLLNRFLSSLPNDGPA